MNYRQRPTVFCFLSIATSYLLLCWHPIPLLPSPRLLPPPLLPSPHPLPPLLLPSLQDVVRIFGNLQELHELSVQLLGSLEESVEMAGEMEEKCPQAGFVFEDVAEVRGPRV